MISMLFAFTLSDDAAATFLLLRLPALRRYAFRHDSVSRAALFASH